MTFILSANVGNELTSHLDNSSEPSPLPPSEQFHRTGWWVGVEFKPSSKVTIKSHNTHFRR